MDFIDLFAGIGGFRKGMEKHGHKCVLSCEIDNNARKSYAAIHNEKDTFPNDVTKLIEKNQLPKNFDVLCAGFPCQPFSRAGRREGFNNGKNGNLFFSVMDIIDKTEPKIVFLENVKGLLTSGIIEEPTDIDENSKIKPKYVEVEKGKTFKIILEYLNKHNYDVQWQLINSAHFIAHKRERVYIIATKRKDKLKQIFPIHTKEKFINAKDFSFDDFLNEPSNNFIKNEFYMFEFDNASNLINSITKEEVVFSNQTPWKNFGLMINGKILTTKVKHEPKTIHKLKDYLQKNEIDDKYILSKEEEEKQRFAKSPKTWRSGNKMGKMSFPDPIDKPSRTLTANSTGREMMVIAYGNKFRKLTAKEYYLLQGFSEEDYNKAIKAGVSELQIKRQAGNAVTVKTIEAIVSKF
ncbi:DNA cytosine methyltransferase [Aliarcobacter cibarius]|uniref:Cytosine-specific methyltransferase n=1 Tax=Aliarcobacter cibarius TaxID=255507 RepID=A0ABY2V4J6_9BACT|nr:DNA (cytosine-5-)-methyltransferase [Aliarcobacter cibarius]TLS99585.1 DNA (cytosine-5-)-methyltransferase [Aliarcobacter cibarius]TLT00022.1 DNA (cytosine-5-)-methyltransferase [Aliarcobacter cibarius]